MKYWCLLLIIFFSCGKKNQREDYNIIQIGESMKSVGEIRISEIGRDISYVALETTDSSLIANYPDMDVWQDKIVVSSMNQPLMVFDKKDGHFCNTIGHIGEGPESLATDGWGNIPFWIDKANGTVYLRALGDNRLLRYSLDGTYLGNVAPAFTNEQKINLFFYYFHISNDTITAHNKYWFEDSPYIFSFNAVNGNLIDTVSAIIQPYPQEQISSNVYIYGTYIPFGGMGMFHFDYVGDKSARIVLNSPSIWEYKGQKYLKESFIDTVYSIQGHSLIPFLMVDLGKWKWPYDKRFEKDNSMGRISVDYMFENDKFIYFHLHTGLYENRNNSYLYCGFFNKKNGTTKIMQGNALVDDIYNFLPISIRKVTSEGEFVGLIQMFDVMAWEENNNTNVLPFFIQSLFKKDEEDNPVIVFIR